MNASATATLAARGAGARRRPRDWVVDTLLFLAAVIFALLVIGGRLESSTPPPAWLFTADVIAGAVGCAGLWLRRRWPVGLAVVLVVFSTFSETVSGAMVVGMLTVAIHRPPRTTAAVFVLSVVAGLVYVVVRPEPGIPAWLLFMIGLAVQSAAVGWGLFIHFRRQLVLSLRDRANRAETEAQLRAEQAQQRARDEIAREMHDVLGHRLSLLSVHAGALEFRPDAPAEEVARAAKVIRENAHQALQDLREVIGVLRAPGRGAAPADPGRRPPARRRVGPGRDAGDPARRDQRPRPRPGRPHRLPGRPGGPDQRPQARPRRRGPRPPGRVPGRGPDRRGPQRRPPGAVRPRAPPRPRPIPPRGPTPGPRVPPGPRPSPGAGQGLAGLAERVALASGRLEHGPTAEGGWRLSAWLPWPA